MRYTRSGLTRIASRTHPSPVLWTLGLSENYPDGRTGNLPFIPSTRKNIAFAARTDLFYTVDTWIARRIFRIPATISRCLWDRSSCLFFPHSGGISPGLEYQRFSAILRPIFVKSNVFCAFCRAESISHFFTAHNNYSEVFFLLFANRYVPLRF